MNVSAIIVTRGDVDLLPVLDSLPPDWEQVIWENGKGVEVGGSEALRITRALPDYCWEDGDRYYPEQHVPDLSVYGRYAAIEYASHDLIYVQDDDVIVSDPQAIVNAWVETDGPFHGRISTLVANMPQEFRHDGYTDSCLVGFGACFHRDAPRRAFERFAARELDDYRPLVNEAGLEAVALFNRTCDVVFTTLTPRVLVDVPKVDREFASDSNRMWKQADHYGERVRMLELARKVRDQ